MLHLGHYDCWVRAGNEGEGLNFMLWPEQAEELAAAKGVELPADFLEAAAGEGLRRSALQAYLALQGTLFAGWLSRLLPAFRDRLIADPRFFFKVCCLSSS